MSPSIAASRRSAPSSSGTAHEHPATHSHAGIGPPDRCGPDAFAPELAPSCPHDGTGVPGESCRDPAAARAQPASGARARGRLSAFRRWRVALWRPAPFGQRSSSAIRKVAWACGGCFCRSGSCCSGSAWKCPRRRVPVGRPGFGATRPGPASSASPPCPCRSSSQLWSRCVTAHRAIRGSAAPWPAFSPAASPPRSIRCIARRICCCSWRPGTFQPS